MIRFKKITCVMLTLALTLSIHPIHAEAAGKSAVVSTQKKLDTALKDKKITKITIKTKKSISLKLKKGNYTTKSIVIDAPKGNIDNSGSFKKISITDARTFTEKASGNQFSITDQKLTLVFNGTPSTISNKRNGILSITNNTAKDIVVTASNGKKTIVKPVDTDSTNGSEVETESKPDASKPDDNSSSSNPGSSDTNSSASTPGENTPDSKPATTPSADTTRFIAAEMVISHILYQDGKIVDITAVHGENSYHMNRFLYDITDTYAPEDIVKIYLSADNSGITVHAIKPSDGAILQNQKIDFQTVNPATSTFSVVGGGMYTLSDAIDPTIAVVSKDDAGLTIVTPISFSSLALLSEENNVTISLLGGTGYVQSILVTVK